MCITIANRKYRCDFGALSFEPILVNFTDLANFSRSVPISTKEMQKFFDKIKAGEIKPKKMGPRVAVFLSSEKVFVSQEKMSGFSVKGADLRDFRGSLGNFLGSLP